MEEPARIGKSKAAQTDAAEPVSASPAAAAHASPAGASTCVTHNPLHYNATRALLKRDAAHLHIKAVRRERLLTAPPAISSSRSGSAYRPTHTCPYHDHPAPAPGSTGLLGAEACCYPKKKLWF
ncbi:hypothetical protein AOLI_G00088700 [Acnodon oligacanthus]